MRMKEYQNAANETAKAPFTSILQASVGGALCEVSLAMRDAVLGLCGEAGELSGALYKLDRDSRGIISPTSHRKLCLELGDVLWYVAQCATELGVSLDDIAEDNIEKLKRRAETGTIHGDGDFREDLS